MKLTMGDYEVEIKAKNTKWNEKYNKDDTNRILLDMAIAFFEASEFCQMQGRQATAKDNAEKWRNIHDALDKVGYFKDI